MRKSIPVEDAVGMVLPHDVTEIVKGVKKGTAFKKGHIIQTEDTEHLKRLGKDHIYAMSLDDSEIHENEAASLLAAGLSGKNIVYQDTPDEGKISLKAQCFGLLRVDKNKLLNFNMLGDVICSTLHDNTPVQQGEVVAATRIIPLVCERSLVEQALSSAGERGIVSVMPLKPLKIGLVITGNEVFYGRIEDGFEEVLLEKAQQLGCTLHTVKKSPDDVSHIAKEIHNCIDEGAELIVTSGGMSVDPDDVTREGIRASGATDIVYGTPVLPGAMFLSGTLGEIPILGLPACAMYHKITVFDLILPRLLTDQKITREIFAELGHGGLCKQCPTCHYPTCNFGK